MRLLPLVGAAAGVALSLSPAARCDVGPSDREAGMARMEDQSETVCNGLLIVHTGMKEPEILEALAGIKPGDYEGSWDKDLRCLQAQLEVLGVLDAKAKGRPAIAVLVKPRR